MLPEMEESSIRKKNHMDTFIELYEEDQNRLRAELTDARSSRRQMEVLEEELDRLLLRYNDHCPTEAARQCAAFGISGARMTVPLLCAGEDPDAQGTGLAQSVAEANERGTGLRHSIGGANAQDTGIGQSGKETSAQYTQAGKKTRLLVKSFILCIGCLISAGSILIPAGSTPALQEILNLRFVLWMLAAGFALILTAFLIPATPSGRKSKSGRNTDTDIWAMKYREASKIDRICSTLRNYILLLDRELEAVCTAEQEKEMAGAAPAGPADEQEAAMLAGLLEAAYSRDGDYALDKLDELKFYLHRKGIRVVDYSEETRTMFDLMPAQHNATIRPALVTDTKVLSRGLAGFSQESSGNL